jgi:hypothetical protein
MHSLPQNLTGGSGLAVEHQDQIDPEVNIAGKDQNVDTESETVSTESQDGVKDIEAITSVWTRSHLIAAYVMLVEQQYYFVVAFGKTDGGMIGSGLSIFSTGALTLYVTSSFAERSLTATTAIMSSLIGGLVQLPLAKILDIWGRPRGFAIMVCLLTVGLVMMAAYNNVQIYAAARAFYWVG